METIRNLFNKYREILLYLVFGVLTTVVSIAVFGLFTEILHMNELLANIISWIAAVTFAYITNSIWVFDAPVHGLSERLAQMAGFYSGRLATLGIEEIILLVFVTWLGMPAMIIKTAAQVLVIALNYVISKLFVFRK